MTRRAASLLLCALALSAALAPAARAQQVGDTSFHPRIRNPAWPPGAGPRVLVDEAHHNFHTARGRFLPFTRVLEADGFRVDSLEGPLSTASLANARILVIANPLSERNFGGNWYLPTPSAYDSAEVAAVKAWVEAGGSLFLIADHMPFPGAAGDLAAAFGFALGNGFAMDDAMSATITYRRADGTLADDPLTRGIDSVTSFTGQAFTGPADARPLLIVPEGITMLYPDTAWQFHATTRREPAGGRWQGAVREVGRGRVAVFGEAAMFSAQRAGPQNAPFGMNAPMAGQNVVLLRRIVEWLAGN